jgi:Leucine-rich repeat (LRR) protein
VPCLAAIAAGCTSTEIVHRPDEYVNITDPVFLDYCLTARDTDGNLRIDLDGDGKITSREAAAVTEISLDNEGGGESVGVRSLEGIEHFTGLRRLNAGTNDISTLDLSRNTALVYLNCADNRLTALDLSKNTSLESLNCSQNSIAELDVSMLPALSSLLCGDNRLTELSIGANTALVELSCGRNLLTALDVSGCSALANLNCGVSDGDAPTDIASLRLPFPSALETLDCGGNKLVGLDLAGQDKLRLLRANANPLTALDISPATSLRILECVDCHLAELDITSNVATLRQLFCNGNPEGMKIVVPAGFEPPRSWGTGTAEFVVDQGE